MAKENKPFVVLQNPSFGESMAMSDPVDVVGGKWIRCEMALDDKGDIRLRVAQDLSDEEKKLLETLTERLRGNVTKTSYGFRKV